MVKENKIINIIKSRIQMAQNGTLFFSFPEFDDEYVGQILSDLLRMVSYIIILPGAYISKQRKPVLAWN